MKGVLKFFGKMSRALFAATSVFIAASTSALTGSQGFSDLNTYQILIIAGGTVTAFGGVWGFVNPK